MVTVGDQAIIGCSTSLDLPVNWDFIPSGSDQIQHLYYAGYISNSYASRISVSVDGNGSYDVIIHSIRLADAGSYICIEYAGSGSEKERYEIVVVGKMAFLFSSSYIINHINSRNVYMKFVQCLFAISLGKKYTNSRRFIVSL